MARGGGGQGGLFDLREDIDRRRDDERDRQRNRDDSERRLDEMDQQRANERRDLSREMMELELSNAELRQVINDPRIQMDDDGIIVDVTKTKRATKTSKRKARTKTGFGSGRFASQFSSGMGFNFSQLSKPKRKRSAAMKAGDKKLSKAFKQANLMCRKKNGQFKKGKSQKDVAKCAHRLRKKM